MHSVGHRKVKTSGKILASMEFERTGHSNNTNGTSQYKLYDLLKAVNFVISVLHILHSSCCGIRVQKVGF
jgi:hypothetical protein